ncbi:MAG: chorismate synthase [Halobacteriovoraceae bacterium]|nr:chorismate synthase [Halobacteriovoraceae bacterium]
MSFGESHGAAMGVVIDGITAGLPFFLEKLQWELSRRSPGKSLSTSSRKEPDEAEILSGIFQGKTLGSPIAVLVRNKDQRQEDYQKMKDSYRPGHADRTTILKYKIRDYRGGGRSSGRETVSRVIAGYFASLIIPEVEVVAFIKKLGPFTFAHPVAELPEVNDYLYDLKKKGESVGGQIGITLKHCPAGLGEPAFDKLKADFAKALLSIGGCVGFSYGASERFMEKPGREISKDINNFGGMEGGISNGNSIEMQAVFKPTSTVGQNALEGRHDPCILPRVLPVAEAMVKFVLADHFLRQNAYKSS